MLKNERHDYILEKIESEGRVLVSELTLQLKVTEDTIRKDLQALSKQGLVKRVHGGALRVDTSITEFETRIEQKKGPKERMAKKALSFLQEGQVIYLDSGTTNLALASQIPLNFKATIITNSPTIALSLTNHSNIDIFVLPGSLNKLSKVLEGATTLEALSKIHFDLCFLGISSLDVEKGITVPSIEESAIKQRVITQSSQTISIVTSEKLGTTSSYFVDEAKALDAIITEKNTSDRILNPFRKIGLQVII